MFPHVLHIISENLYKKSSDAIRTPFIMTVVWCLYKSYVHDSTMLWDLFEAPTTSHHMLSVCARAFTEIDHDDTKNVIDMKYATPQPWHVLIAWSLNHVNFHSSHLIILAFHIHIIIPMHVPFQSLEPIAGTLISICHYHVNLVPSFHQQSLRHFIDHLCLGFIFKTLKESLEIFGKIFPIQLTQVHSKFDPISM
jgi:hypothetical protein